MILANMLNSDQDKVEFVKKLSDLILAADQDFPLSVNIVTASVAEDRLALLKDYLSKEICQWEIKSLAAHALIGLNEKAVNFIKYLHKNDWSFLLDYTQFHAHPGLVIVKNVSPDISLQKLILHLNQFCLFLSLLEAEFADDKDTAVILTFTNFLDAEEILTVSDVFDFSEDVSKPLIFEKYTDIRKSSLTLDSENCAKKGSDSLQDAIVIENADEFFPYEVTLEKLELFLEKFILFGDLDSVCFPIQKLSDTTFKVEKAVLIGFKSEPSKKAKVLEALYFLGELTYEELLSVTEESISVMPDHESSKPEVDFQEPRAHLALVQKRHGHQISKNLASEYIHYDSGKLMVHKDSDGQEVSNQLFSRFSKPNNYQETNVYVNNLPILFHNDDNLWHQFWNQFGFDGINSAKIIKPQFYTRKHTETVGKIGFVFYKEFKMALRAIIMTNNKEVYYPGLQPVLIQTSFAIQKKNNSWSSSKYLYSKNGFQSANSRDIPMNSPLSYSHRHMMKRASLPALGTTDFSSYALMGGPDPGHGYMVPPFDPYIFNPYYVQMPGYGMDNSSPPPPSTNSPLSSPRSNGGTPLIPSALGGAFAPPYGYMMPFYPFTPPIHMSGRSTSFGEAETSRAERDVAFSKAKR